MIRTSTSTKPSSHAAHRDAVGGHRVVETLLDAFAFFQRCDPSLARREPKTGALSYFPLAGLMVVLGDYERRHPDHLNRTEVAARALQLAQDGPPAGSGREIQYRLTVNGTVMYYGYTGPQPTVENFTEPGQQIVRDIQASYPYSVVDAAGARHPVAVGADGQLHANGQMLEHCSLRNKPAWLTGLTMTDPDNGLYYWDERRGRLPVARTDPGL